MLECTGEANSQQPRIRTNSHARERRAYSDTCGAVRTLIAAHGDLLILGTIYRTLPALVVLASCVLMHWLSPQDGSPSGNIIVFLLGGYWSAQFLTSISPDHRAARETWKILCRGAPLAMLFLPVAWLLGGSLLSFLCGSGSVILPLALIMDHRAKVRRAREQALAALAHRDVHS